MPKARSSKAGPPDLSEEPEGWRELQERAQNERDPKKLMEIIDEMNRLLTECERRAGRGGKQHPPAGRPSPKQASATP